MTVECQCDVSVSGVCQCCVSVLSKADVSGRGRGKWHMKLNHERIVYSLQCLYDQRHISLCDRFVVFASFFSTAIIKYRQNAINVGSAKYNCHILLISARVIVISRVSSHVDITENISGEKRGGPATAYRTVAEQLWW